MARLASTPDCGIKGCTRAATKGELCAMHHEMVPLAMVYEGVSEGMIAQNRIARKHARRRRLYVAKLVAQTGVDS